MTKTISTKDKILDVAIDLFSQNGYSGVSIREITREVGIKESSLYNHFQNKDEIIMTIFSMFQEEFAKTLPPIEVLDVILANSSIEQFFAKGFENFKEHIDQPVNEKLWRILYIEHYRNTQARELFLNDIIKKTLDFLEVVFEKLIALGKVKPFDPSLLAAEYQYPMFSMLVEYNMLRFDGKDTSLIEKRMKDHLVFLLDIIKIEGTNK
ncbi:TetR/AcrR family transcriptional regulator [Neobacillus niacini]|uniref:TetR/AcrR family transcriptional regulator n=1 Tax=Neobacillus niacini TaxID=86668 RepID=UPI0021CB8490|nr:TetR/AcrR family transcriptional regulator [Neobacillus niacini]MCM3767682.1 TetR/AcrR family transcriptional regulator [Neobacillus niacini]